MKLLQGVVGVWGNHGGKMIELGVVCWLRNTYKTPIIEDTQGLVLLYNTSHSASINRMNWVMKVLTHIFF
jgi:hypothetical protein